MSSKYQYYQTIELTLKMYLRATFLRLNFCFLSFGNNLYFIFFTFLRDSLNWHNCTAVRNVLTVFQLSGGQRGSSSLKNLTLPESWAIKKQHMCMNRLNIRICWAEKDSRWCDQWNTHQCWKWALHWHCIRDCLSNRCCRTYCFICDTLSSNWTDTVPVPSFSKLHIIFFTAL